MAGHGDPLFLEVKEARRSVLEAYAGSSLFPNAGQRIVDGYRQSLGGATTLTVNLYDIKYVGKDFVVLANAMTEVKITFADSPKELSNSLLQTKQQHARFFKHRGKVGLENPTAPSGDSGMIKVYTTKGSLMASSNF